MKTVSIGVIQWNKTFNGTGSESARRLIQTDDEEYVLVGESNSTGIDNHDIWLVKTDIKGKTIPGFSILSFFTAIIAICCWKKIKLKIE